MDLYFAQRGVVELMQQAMQSIVEIFCINPRKELRDLLLRDGGSQVNIPRGQTGEGFRVTRQQAMQEGRSAAEVAKDEERFFDGMFFIGGEENVVQPEEEPVHTHAWNPDNAEQDEENQSFAGEAGGGIFCCKERAIECAPKKLKVIFHV